VDSTDTYTTYVNLREFQISAYIKEVNQANSFCIPLDDAGLELEMQDLALRTLRVEIKAHGKWLLDQGLHTLDAWAGKTEPYKRIFALLRKTLRLDEGLRIKRLKTSTIETMALSAREKKLLKYHIKDGAVYEHPEQFSFRKGAWHKFYSAMKVKVLDIYGIDLDLPYAVQKKLMSPKLSELLVYTGECVPAEHLAGYVHSRTSMPVVLRLLEAIIQKLLYSGRVVYVDSPAVTCYRGSLPKPSRKHGLAHSPVCLAAPQTVFELGRGGRHV
jgi:hypothetical protein